MLLLCSFCCCFNILRSSLSSFKLSVRCNFAFATSCNTLCKSSIDTFGLAERRRCRSRSESLSDLLRGAEDWLEKLLLLQLNSNIEVVAVGLLFPTPLFDGSTKTSSSLSNLVIFSLGLYLHPKLSGTPLDTDGLSPSVTSYSRT